MNEKRVRPGFMGIGYFEEVDASEFIEAGRCHGLVDLTEDERAGNDEARMVAEAKEVVGPSLKIALDRFERSSADLIDIMERMDKATMEWMRDGTLEAMDEKTKKDVLSKLKKVEYNLGKLDTLTEVFMREVSPRLKK